MRVESGFRFSTEGAVYSSFQPFLFTCKVNDIQHQGEKRAGVGEEVESQNGKVELGS